MKKKEEARIAKELLDVLYTYDYEGYYKTKASIKEMTPRLSKVIERVESHPTFGKSEEEHKRYVAGVEERRHSEYEEEMMRDALMGRHYKHANVMFGKVYYGAEYRRVCEKLGIVLKERREESLGSVRR